MELPGRVEVDPWSAMRADLRRILGQGAYEIWLAPLASADWDGVTLSLTGPGETCAWVERRYGRILSTCAESLLGRRVEVRLLPQGDPRSPQSRRIGAGAPEQPPGIGPGGRALNPRYSFDQFIIGEGNHLAHSAALSVAELPGQTYNPLFLYAPPGLGKTHLLHAIGNYVTAFGGGSTVRCTTVEDFTNHFLSALSSRTLDAFKREYRNSDVLLIDDVQFLASKARTEEEFFHTFNALHENGRQMVLTCDRLPSQLAAIEQRLRERFEAGLVAEIRPPDFPTRVAILRKRVTLDSVEIAEHGVLEAIAARVTDNIRALEGALIRVVAYHSLTGRPIDLELVRTVLDSMYPPAETAPLGLSGIQETVAGRHGLSVEELTSGSRAARVLWPRQVAMHLARELTGESLPTIGAAFGGRNHATVLHGIKRVSERMRDDEDFRREVEQLLRELRSQHHDRVR